MECEQWEAVRCIVGHNYAHTTLRLFRLSIYLYFSDVFTVLLLCDVVTILLTYALFCLSNENTFSCPAFFRRSIFVLWHALSSSHK